MASMPALANAQQGPGMPIIGFLNPRTASSTARVVEAFKGGLWELGFVEGKSVAIEYRWAEDRYERMPDLAADLVRRNVAVIVAGGSGEQAKAATSTIPVVFTSGLDPVERRLVASLSRPEANLTGATFYSGALGAKQMELLRDVLPGARHVALLVNADSPSGPPQARDARSEAAANGLRLTIAETAGIGGLEAALAVIRAASPDALLISVDPSFDSRPGELVAVADRLRLPTIYYARDFVDAGGFLSYGASIADAYRQAGVYAGRILKGAKPADLPVVQPTRFELVVNLKAASLLGLTFPQSILLRADEVIE
jgi:putative ABC transport system substrate-binding protein